MIFFNNGSRHIAVRVSEGLVADRYKLVYVPEQAPRQKARHRMDEWAQRCRDCGRTVLWLASDTEHQYEPCIPDLVVPDRRAAILAEVGK